MGNMCNNIQYHSTQVEKNVKKIILGKHSEKQTKYLKRLCVFIFRKGS